MDQPASGMRERPADGNPTAAAVCADSARIPLASVDVNPQYQVPLHPCGFTWTFRVHSTWGDPDFFGLNGLEFIGTDGELIPETPSKVHSAHGSVNRLPGMQSDVRTVENLLDGVNDTLDDRHMFLAPFVRKQVLDRLEQTGEAPVGNCIEVVFDTPVTVALLAVWNYAKTPARGAKDVEVLVDDRLIYRGVFRDVRQRSGFQESVLFTDQAAVVARYAPWVYAPDPAELATTVMIDEGQDVTLGVTQLEEEVCRRRPMTAVSQNDGRPTRPGGVPTFPL